MTKASDNVFPRFLISEGGSTSTPAAARVTMYAKADGLLYSKDDAGVETLVSGGAGGGSVATDAIWDAKGDLAGGTGANTAARLAVGANGTILTAASGETTGLIWTAYGTYGDWAPVLTADAVNPTMGSGSTTPGRYTQLGKHVIASGEVNFGTGAAAGSGQYEFTFPVAPRTTLQKVLGTAILYDSSAATFYTGTCYQGDTGEFRIAVPSASLIVSNTVPFTWADGDGIWFNLIYEAA